MIWQFKIVGMETDDPIYEDSPLSFIMVRQTTIRLTVLLPRQFGFIEQGRKFLLRRVGHFEIWAGRDWFEAKIFDYDLPDLKNLFEELNDNDVEWTEEYIEGQEHNSKPM
jgi:hypothetical protein